MKQINSKFKPTALALVAMALLASCGSKNLSQADVDKKVAAFSGAPTVVEATFKQNYELKINDSRTFLQSFAAKVNDETKIELDFSEGNVYYYAKRTSGSSVVEHLLRKEGNAYEYYTTSTLKKTVEGDTAAIAKVNEMLKSLTYRTGGYADKDIFNYDAEWLQEYVLLGSENVETSDSKYFSYKYSETKDKGLKIEADLQLVGYFGDMGTFEFGVNDTHTGSSVVLETSKEGYIVNFEQTLNNHLDMALFDPPAPLDLEGSRSLSATYNGTLNKKAEITQNLVPGTIVLPTIENATITSYDFKNGDFSTLAVPSTTVSVGNYVVVKVTPAEGYEVDYVKVNNDDTTLMNGFYSYMKEAESGKTYMVSAAVKKVGGEDLPKTSAIVLPTVEHATITSYDFNFASFSGLDKPSLTVTAGNFVAIKVVCDAGYAVDYVKVNDTETALQNGYYVLMAAAVAGSTYNVSVALKAA